MFGSAIKFTFLLALFFLTLSVPVSSIPIQLEARSLVPILDKTGSIQNAPIRRATNATVPPQPAIKAATPAQSSGSASTPELGPSKAIVTCGKKNHSDGKQTFTVNRIQATRKDAFKVLQAKQTFGANLYPHEFKNRGIPARDNKPAVLPLRMSCPGKINFQLFPLLPAELNKDALYRGKRPGVPRDAPGQDRVVFAADDGTYCGVITHRAAVGRNEFELCDGS